MGGRGACDLNKFQILFPATSGSSCVQALRPFPTSPFPQRIVPFHCLVSQGNPCRRVCGKSVCHCVFVTLWVFLEGEGLCPTPQHQSCSPSFLPPIPWSLWPPTAICSWPHPSVQSGLRRGSWNRWPSPTPSFLESPLSFLSTLQ